MWIGATDSETEGTFKWVKGDPWEYPNWVKCPPDNDVDKNCGEIKPNANGKWKLDLCSNLKRRYLCQKGSPTSQLLWTKIHNAEYAYIENNRCIKSWDQAKDRCEEVGGHIASVLSQEVTDQYIAAFSLTEPRHWIGLNDNGTEGTWVWDKGESYAWQHWYTSEPDNKEDEDCVREGFN